MNFESILTGVMNDASWGRSLGLFAPELILCVSIVALLLLRLVNADRWLPSYLIPLFASLTALGIAVYSFFQMHGAIEGIPTPGTTQTMFTGLLAYDSLTLFLRVFLLGFLALVVTLTMLSGIPDAEDGPDFYTLLLGSTIGMMLMSSANHLLILFLGIEMTSVPSYAMVGFLKGRRVSSEAAFKYVVYGAGAAGVMLYGISLLGGLTGTLEMPVLASRLSALLGPGGMNDPTSRTVALAAMMVLVGLAFKLSVFPFHFWCPDAFEGAAAEVGGYLSVASKGAAFALLVRFLLAFTGGTSVDLTSLNLALGVGLGVVAAATATFGNLAAYSQTNVKRLLAYSTIAHAGYMLMGVAAMVVLLNGPGGVDAAAKGEAATCIEGLLYYLAVYLFMNLGAFAIVAFLRNEIYSEEISDYAGLGRQVPLLGACMMICLFSLIGLPPFGGFVGKFMIFASLFQAGKIHMAMWVILVIGTLNTIFSLFYYLRVLKVMFLESRPEGARRARVSFMPSGAFVLLVTLPLLLLGASPLVNSMSDAATRVASMLVASVR